MPAIRNAAAHGFTDYSPTYNSPECCWIAPGALRTWLACATTTSLPMLAVL